MGMSAANALGAVSRAEEDDMRNRTALFLTPALAAGIACQPRIDTLPPTVSPTAAVQYYDLEIPPGLEIRDVDFSAATFSDVFGAPGGATTSTASGRAFVKVYAVHRNTGEQFLLVYEDVARRRRPVQVIRFVQGTERLQPDSAR